MTPSARTVAIVTAFALLGMVIGLTIGVETYAPSEIWSALGGQGEQGAMMLWRGQRVLTAFLVGAGLAMAGVLYQGAFRNPLAEPYLLGSAAGGSLGALFAILVPIPWLAAIGLPALAFLGAWGATMLVLVISRLARIDDAAGMLLVGIALAALLSAIRSATTLVLSDESTNLRAMLSWTLGGLQSLSGTTLAVFAVLLAISLALAVRLARPLDILGLGEATASTMGVNVGRLLTQTLTLAAFVTGLAVAWGGVLGFVGLIVPHVLRWWIGERHGPLLLHSAIVGGGFLAILDGVSRALIPPSEIPIGLISALIGAPFFLLLLVRRYHAQN